MAQYYIAQWDYTAVGDYELSFKEGDRIKLLERHNDDWWEGELNDEIGFFPANRLIEDTSAKNNTATPPSTGPANQSNPYLFTPKESSRRQSEALLVDISTENSDSDHNEDITPTLPKGWSYSYDSSKAIYYFNEVTGESQWELPTVNNQSDSIKTPVQTTIEETQGLSLDSLNQSWIRYQGPIHMKVILDKYETSWKDYYAVLMSGFLLIYKEGVNKKTRRPTSLSPMSIFGTIELEDVEIHPSAKLETKKRNAFTIIYKNLMAIIQIANDASYAEWLDMLMREMISIKEQEVPIMDGDLLSLLKSMPLETRFNSRTAENEATGSSLIRWFSRSKANSGNRRQSVNISNNTASVDTQLFGGYLKLEENGDVPSVVKLCIEQIEKRGMDVVGIYRLSGQMTSIQKYRTLFNTLPDEVNLDEENDINVITGLLKLYFRELKNPLLTYEYYDRFIEAIRLQDYDERMFRLKSIIQVLPVANYKVFHYLTQHLSEVASNSSQNKMEASNLALIFSIGLLRSKQEDVSSSIMHNDLISRIVETIIKHVDWFFDTDTDEDTFDD